MLAFPATSHERKKFRVVQIIAVIYGEYDSVCAVEKICIQPNILQPSVRSTDSTSIVDCPFGI